MITMTKSIMALIAFIASIVISVVSAQSSCNACNCNLNNVQLLHELVKAQVNQTLANEPREYNSLLR